MTFNVILQPRNSRILQNPHLHPQRSKHSKDFPIITATFTDLYLTPFAAAPTFNMA